MKKHNDPGAADAASGFGALSEETVMTVKFFAYYRDPDFAGCKEMDWPQEADSVIVLCRQIAERFGDKFRTELLTPDGNGICDRSIVMVNGRRIDFIGGPEAPLKDTDTVLIFPVVAGG